MSTETKDQVEDLKITEGTDGSVSIDLPNDIPSPQGQDDQDDEAHADGGSIGDEDHPDDTPEEREERRSARKARRERQKTKIAEKDMKLQVLERQNRELMERLSVVERKTHSSDLARVDKAIEDQELRLQYARLKMTEATSAGDGDAMAKAQDLWYETRRQIEALQAMKKNAVQPRQDQNIPDPRLQRNANAWMERNSWFKADGDDMDSKIAKQLDEKLSAEGWNPNDPDYWEELDNRLQRYIPHRYNQDTDEVPSSRRSKPRSVVTSSGREISSNAGGKNTFTLAPEQVRAMKDAGFWDDPVKRNKMIKRYAQEARNNNNGYRS